MLYRPSHELAGANGYVLASRAALFASIGPGEHACHWCGAAVRWATGLRGNHDGVLIVDHLDGDKLNDAEGNLAPSCWVCNTNRAKTARAHVSDDETFIVRRNGTRLRAMRRICQHCGAEFLAPLGEASNGGARFCGRSCARKAEHQQRRK